jgi:hypothetical protein
MIKMLRLNSHLCGEYKEKTISVMSQSQCRPLVTANADQRLSLLEEPLSTSCAVRVRSPTSCAILDAQDTKDSAISDSDTMQETDNSLST